MMVQNAFMVQVAISEAKGQLTALARRAEEGEEIALTRHGRVVARLVPPLERKVVDRVQMLRELEAISARGRLIREKYGFTGKQLQDEIYDDNGLPI
jgi:prevent-host-death family protein